MIRLPILLIHGFNGAPSNWTGAADHFPQMLAAQGYDPELIRVFNYGYAESEGKRYYNSTGDLRQIAHRLDEANSNDPELIECSVDQLSEASRQRGGPEKITIIAHSSGGLIARYYLTRQSEDAFGTRYRGNVARAIFLGTPHQGVDGEDILDPLPSNLTYGLMLRFHYLFPRDYNGDYHTFRTRFRHLRKKTWRDWNDTHRDDQTTEMPAFRQMHPGSEFLNDINRPGAMPPDVIYFNIVGDIRAGMRLQIGKRVLLDKEKDFGDFLVTVKSAGGIPNAASHCFSVTTEYSVQVKAARPWDRVLQIGSYGDHPLPIHRHLRRHPVIHQRVLEILGED
jgi:pimeloyl-ACP methyl ester carboxylesterase